MEMGKDDIMRAGIALGVDYALTVSCYQATDDGLACGKCDSCRLRRAGLYRCRVSPIPPAMPKCLIPVN